MEQWSNGAMEQWSNGAMEQWSNGAMEQWSNGAMEQWSNGAMEQWSALITCRAHHRKRSSPGRIAAAALVNDWVNENVKIRVRKSA